MDVSPLNLGMIAAYYYITYTTIELFANSLTAKTKLKARRGAASASPRTAFQRCCRRCRCVRPRACAQLPAPQTLTAPLPHTHIQPQGLLEIISAASEFDALPVRPGEEVLVEKLLNHAPVAVDRPRFTDPHTKANALLQAHFGRVPLQGDMAADQRNVVTEAVRLLQARRSLVASPPAAALPAPLPPPPARAHPCALAASPAHPPTLTPRPSHPRPPST